VTSSPPRRVPQCVNLEALSPRSLAQLCVAATLRAQLTHPVGRPSLEFWTAREPHAKHVEVLGKVRGKVSPVRPVEQPADAKAFVRVWAGDVWDVLLKDYPAITLAVEGAAQQELSLPGPRHDTAHRARALRLAQYLEAAAWAPDEPAAAAEFPAMPPPEKGEGEITRDQFDALLAAGRAGTSTT
jgi:hypothetical protein